MIVERETARKSFHTCLGSSVALVSQSGIGRDRKCQALMETLHLRTYGYAGIWKDVNLVDGELLARVVTALK